MIIGEISAVPWRDWFLFPVCKPTTAWWATFIRPPEADFKRARWGRARPKKSRASARR